MLAELRAAFTAFLSQRPNYVAETGSRGRGRYPSTTRRCCKAPSTSQGLLELCIRSLGASYVKSVTSDSNVNCSSVPTVACAAVPVAVMATSPSRSWLVHRRAPQGRRSIEMLTIAVGHRMHVARIVADQEQGQPNFSALRGKHGARKKQRERQNSGVVIGLISKGPVHAVKVQQREDDCTSCSAKCTLPTGWQAPGSSGAAVMRAGGGGGRRGWLLTAFGLFAGGSCARESVNEIDN